MRSRMSRLGFSFARSSLLTYVRSIPASAARASCERHFATLRRLIFHATSFWISIPKTGLDVAYQTTDYTHVLGEIYVTTQILPAVGSSSAMVAQKREQRLDSGIRNLQVIGALSLYQGHQLSKTVDSLNANLENQTALLENIADGIGVVASKIDDVKREQVIARLKQEREEIAKEAVFQFKQECDRLASETNAFTAYFHYRALEAELEDSGISSRDLPSISDKQFLADVEAAIDAGMKRCRAAFTREEAADLDAFEDLVDYEFEDIDELLDSKPRKLARQFSEVEQNPRLITKSDLETALGDELRPLDLDKYYKGYSYVWWPLGFAAFAAALPLAMSEQKAAIGLAILGWLTAMALVLVVNVLRAIFPSRKRLEATREKILERVRQDHRYTFDEGSKIVESVRSIAHSIEERRERARLLVARYDFLREPLQPYFDFSAPKVL